MRHTLRSWLAAASLAGLALLSGCGGGSDDPASPPPPPPPETVGPPVVDTARASSASIGPAGGTVRATAADGVEYTLTVPARALTETVTIRMTPIIDLRNPALANGLTGAVQFEPSGLRFLLPATLRIGTQPTLSGGRRLFGFSSANDGTGMQLKLPTVRNGGIEVMVAHFSNAGAAAATPEEAAQGLAPNQDPGESDFWVREILLGDRLPATVGENLLSWFNGVVSPRLAAAASGTDDAILEALGAYETWTNAIDAVPNTFNFGPAGEAQMLGLLAAQIDRAKTLMSDILRARLDADLAACRTTPGVGSVESASLMQQLAARNGLDTPERGLDRAGFLRNVNACLRPVLDPAKLPDALGVGQPQSLDLRAQVVLNGQPDPVDLPFQFTVTPTGAAVATPVGFSDADGRFTTVFTPSVDTPTFDVRACLVLNDANGTTGSDICVTQQLSSSAGTVYSGMVSTTITNLSIARGIYSETLSGFLRVSLDAQERVTALDFSGSYSDSLVSTILGCQIAPSSTVLRPPLTESSSAVVTSVDFVGSGSNPLTLGNFNFFGIVAVTTETFVNPSIDCSKVSKTATAPRPLSTGSIDLVAFVRDAAGSVVALNFDQNIAAESRVSTGRLVRER